MAGEIVPDAVTRTEAATLQARPVAAGEVARRHGARSADGRGTERVRSSHGGGPSSDCYILAHQDDEFFFAPLIERSVRERRNPLFIYTTDGTWYGVPPAVRMRETADVLRGLGVPVSNIHQVGVTSGIRDGYSHLHLDKLFERVRALTEAVRIRAVYVLAWEGGHADHDAAHLLGAALARERNVSALYECPSYNAHRAPRGLFRVMHWIPRAGAIESRRLSLRQAARWYRLAFRYPSQWRTFVGLSCMAFPRYVLRRHACRRVGEIDYTARPHAGELLYERRFGLPFERFREATSSFVASRLGPMAATPPSGKERCVA